MKRQCMKVLSYMKDHGSITSNEANYYLGVSRLSARIWDLKNLYGYEIGKQPRKARDRDGVMTVFDAYFLEEDQWEKKEGV